MDINFLSLKFIILYVFIVSACYVHFRGRERLSFRQQLFNFSTFLAPYNSLVYLFSKVPSTPILDLDDFPQLRPLKDNWQVIRDEAQRLLLEEKITAARNRNDISFNSFFRHGWRRFYLKWYGESYPSARLHCPRTVALLNEIPDVNAALFALLPAGSQLTRHRDPFAGSLRYHLGLITPNHDQCRIYVDGQKYSWRDGEAVLFDETYIHSARNDTDQDRLILFCDIKRPIGNPVFRAVNDFVTRHVVKATTSPNASGEKIGVLNYISPAMLWIKTNTRGIKRRHRTPYLIAKYLLYGGILALIML